jgi:AbrB family looped-hinge helix DNA binding protein
MTTLRIGRRGQITIPSALRRRLELSEGDRVTIIERQGELVLRPAGRALLELRGSIVVSEPQDFGAIRAQAVEWVARGAAERADEEIPEPDE